jgi:hypothetical protein
MNSAPSWTRDPALHLITLATLLVAVALAVTTRPAPWFSRRPVLHPPGCHACALCPPDAAHQRDMFLLRTGGIEDDGE